MPLKCTVSALTAGFYSVTPVTSRAFSPLCSASSVCKSLQCLTFPHTRGQRRPLTQAHLFPCAVRREGHCKQTRLACVGSARSGWTTLGLPEPTVASLPGPHCSGFKALCTGHCPRRALLAVHFPGLSRPGSQVLRKGTGPDGLCVLYPSQVLGECTTPGGPCVSCSSLVPASQCPRCALRAQSQMSHVSPPQSRSQAVTVLTEVNRPESQEDVAINGEPAQVW